jgi:elongator complex protein 3
LGIPQSYTGREPAALRALQNRFDPYDQIRCRIKQLKTIGHDVGKVELIILGGTFTALPYNYQVHFVKRCLDGIIGTVATSLDEAKTMAEISQLRNVGISVETRPDWAQEKHIDRLTYLGVTRVELGVQTIYDDVYKLIMRGHTVEEVCTATRILKDSGFKVVYHIMPGIFSSFRQDLKMFKELFINNRFKPDAIKIYPTLILEGTKLHKLWKNGKYDLYSPSEVIDLIVEIKKIIPKWIRIQRIQRDIPSNLITAGVKISNLRQLIDERMKERDVKCRCIRCREVGHKMLKDKIIPEPDNIKLIVSREKASKGEDLFLSFEDEQNDCLIGYLRLRIPSEMAHRNEINTIPISIIRELHIFGAMVPVGGRKLNAWQHLGYGKRLIEEAERISKEYDRRKIVILSALGSKRYYKRLGYNHDGPYMSKITRLK